MSRGKRCNANSPKLVRRYTPPLGALEPGEAAIPGHGCEAMGMIIVPAHEQLNHAVQLGDRQAIRQPNPPPNREMDVAQQGFQLQPMRGVLFQSLSRRYRTTVRLAATL